MDLIEKYLGESEFPIGQGASYKSVNDAEPYNSGYGKGSTEIWYMNPKHFRNFSMGPDFIKKYYGTEEGEKMEMEPMPTAKTLSKTHVLLGKIKETKKENIFRMMQGENWSPAGEARNLIRSKGLKHTSMSVGDIIKIGSNIFMADNFGFKKL
jgi:hypothetical protein